MYKDDFRDISVNGRFTFGTFCLEHALQFYRAPQAFWNRILEELWKIAESKYIDKIHAITPLQPMAVNGVTYADYLRLFNLEIAYYTTEEIVYYETEMEFIQAQNQFISFPELAWIFDALASIKEIVSADNTEIMNPAILNEVQDILDIMQSNHIPLPDISLFKFSSWKLEDGHGRPISRKDIPGSL